MNAQARSRRGRRPALGVLLRTEVFKVFSTRSLWLTLAAIIVLQIPPLLLWGGQGDPRAAWNGLRSRAGLFPGYLLMVFGVLLASQEYRYRTATLSWLVTPRRHRVFAAQVLVVAATAGITVTVTFAAWVVMGTMRLGASALHVDVPGELLGAYAGTAVAVVAAAVLGVCAATITRSGTAALLGLAALGIVELAVDELRFIGPTTSILRILAWPTSEGSVPATVAMAGWVVMALTAGALALRRDLPGG